MELLLWLWLYDPRWFFNLKINIKLYRNSWLLPLSINLINAFVSSYYIKFSEESACESTLRLWLITRILFSVLIIINILFFIYKITITDKKERIHFENAKKVYPDIVENMNEYDYWIRRKSLISTSGVLLLFLGMISLFWSYVIIKLYYVDNQFSKCNIQLITFIKFYAFTVFLTNFPVMLMFLLLISVKLGSFICAYTCPAFLIWISKRLSPSLLKRENSLIS